MPRRPVPPALHPQNWQIQNLPGINPEDVSTLITCGVTTTFQLCQRTRTLAERHQLASQLQIHPRYVNKWAALARLACIPSVGCRYCGLLLHAGIASPSQLAKTPLAHLHRQILRLQVAMMQRPDLCPSLEEIGQWIAQARQLSQSSANR